MKKLFLACLLIGLTASTAYTFDLSVLAVITKGTIQAEGLYNAQGGDNPYFQTQYECGYYAKGTAGIAMENSYSGALITNEQFEVQGGYGKYVTKAGTGTLVNTQNEGTAVTTGILTQNAIGFGGAMVQGITNTTFGTAGGLIGTADSQGIGIFQAGAIQAITSGSSDPLVLPKTDELSIFHITIGPGAYQSKMQFAFPK